MWTIRINLQGTALSSFDIQAFRILLDTFLGNNFDTVTSNRFRVDINPADYTVRLDIEGELLSGSDLDGISVTIYNFLNTTFTDMTLRISYDRLVTTI